MAFPRQQFGMIAWGTHELGNFQICPIHQYISSSDRSPIWVLGQGSQRHQRLMSIRPELSDGVANKNIVMEPATWFFRIILSIYPTGSTNINQHPNINQH